MEEDPRVPLAQERTGMASERTRLAHERTRLARERTHLANRRTYLAWSRTSLGVMSLGFVLDRLHIFLRTNNIDEAVLGHVGWMGMAAFVLGGVLALVALWRYLVIRKRTGTDNTEIWYWPEILLSFCIAGGAVVFPVIWNTMKTPH